VKAYNIPKVASTLGMDAGEESEAFSSKRAYVVKRLVGWPKGKLVELAKTVQETYPNDSLQRVIEEFDASQPYRISSITRQHLFSCIDSLPPIQGKIEIVEFMEKLWPLRTMRPSGFDLRCMTAHDEVCQHMVLNDDYSFPQMLEHLGLMDMSNRKLVELLEWAVHPLVRTDSDQLAYTEGLNANLKHDGYALVACDQMSGYPIFRVAANTSGVQGAAKNLIFASTGPKPEIVLSDAINNDILLVKNEEYCLVYDKPLTKDGLLWSQLVAWWAERNSLDVSDETERKLYSRLTQSLSTAPEKLLFRTFFKTFRPLLGHRLPALVPQVYLHYDPYTLAQLAQQRRLPRQRMDFLFLLSSFERIVIEVDGHQHYSDAGKPSPQKYAEMASADRQLRLLGYEVYRFGGAELAEGVGETVITDFFTGLFRKHGVRQDSPMPPANGD
jgi:very-short-patch-repair endonuclease